MNPGSLIPPIEKQISPWMGKFPSIVWTFSKMMRHIGAHVRQREGWEIKSYATQPSRLHYAMLGVLRDGYDRGVNITLRVEQKGGWHGGSSAYCKLR